VCDAELFEGAAKMKNILVIILLVLFLAIFVSCQNIQNIVSPINKPIQETTSDLTPIGTVTSMHAYTTALSISERSAPFIVIDIAPTSKAIAGKIYPVELYEKGVLRAKGQISWNQPQINVKKPVDVYFPASEDECNAYVMKDITGIFSIKILEGTSATGRHTVTAVTTFHDLLSWGIPAEEIEKVIGEKPLALGYCDMLNYCYDKHKDLSTLLTALQKLADKYQ